jgi:hypothetical protein
MVAAGRISAHFAINAAPRKGTNPIVTIDTEGKQQVVEANKVLVAVGFKPNSSGIGLKRVGAKLDGSARHGLPMATMSPLIRSPNLLTRSNHLSQVVEAVAIEPMPSGLRARGS